MSELHQALTRCAIYPEPTRHVEYRETHISHLYLTDNLVYKIKKNVDFGFCNFTSLDRRRFYCEEEVRLNRRLAPDCYLGVSKIVKQGERFLIDQPGSIYEYAVRMKRLPQDKMLSGQLSDCEQQEQLSAKIADLGQMLAQFHSKATRVDMATHNDRLMIQHFWKQNFEQTRSCPTTIIRRTTFTKLEELVMCFIHEHAELFSRRQQLGYIRDGHGDLHSEHICLTEPLQIFDCLEFNPDLRYGDILNDFAFLYMDLAMHRRRDLAQTLWQNYQSGLDPGPQAERLLRFYCLYRAWVRGKVHSLQAKTIPADAALHQHQAQAYFRLAGTYTLPQALLLCYGLIGSGKSTLAQDLARALDTNVISSDQIRLMTKNTSPSNPGYAKGDYSLENRLAIYRKIAEIAMPEISKGRTIIVDATFEKIQMRTPFVEMAKQAGIPCLFIECHCDPALIRQRLLARATDPSQSSGSEARLPHFEEQQKHFEPLSKDLVQISVDTGQPREYNVDFLIEKLIEACGTL